MYCLQCLIPVLLIPKPTNPALMQTHVMFIVLYLIGFFLELAWAIAYSGEIVMVISVKTDKANPTSGMTILSGLCH